MRVHKGLEGTTEATIGSGLTPSKVHALCLHKHEAFDALTVHECDHMEPSYRAIDIRTVYQWEHLEQKRFVRADSP